MEPTCIADDCDRTKLASRGMCSKHYTQWYRAGHSRPKATPKPKRDDITYYAAHLRVYAEKGKARDYQCIECGEPAHCWAYDHKDPKERLGSHAQKKEILMPYSTDPAHYQPMCRACHTTLDDGKRGGRKSWKKYPKTCACCLTDFVALRNNARFCTDRCKTRAADRRSKGLPENMTTTELRQIRKTKPAVSLDEALQRLREAK